MSTACDNLRNVKMGRTDWKVKVRIIRHWKVITKMGQVFKGFNLLLLDSKNCRMHAFVPGNLSDKMSRIIEIGKIYMLKNFQVKDYTEQDKFRVVHMDRQIIFSQGTKVKELDEKEIYIPQNMFDLYEFGDLKKMATQHLYLTDVIGVLQKKEPLNRYEKDEKAQVNIKFKLTDGKKKVNVTFWDSFAEEFEREITKQLEEPIIVIIASGKISSWKDEIDICNYSPTRFYLNYDHHSVVKLRKMLKETNFSVHHMTTTKKPSKICTISEIKMLGEEFIQEEVVCKATFKCVEKSSNWKKHFCTTCYSETEARNEEQYCKNCNRIVPHTLKRFHISSVASDTTGEIQIILNDREVRTLLGKTVEEVETKDESFPNSIQTIQGMDCSIKLLITKDNINKKAVDYVATNILVGWNFEEETEQDETMQSTQTFTTQPSGSSYHLDELSQLNYETTGISNLGEA